MKLFNTEYRIQDTRYRIQNTEYRLHGFTLMELLLYSGILVISAGLIGGIVYTISKANLRTQAEEEVNSLMMRLEEVFRQKIEVAKGVNNFGVGGAILELNMGNSTTTFSLSNFILYLNEGTGDLPLNDPNKVKVTSLVFSPTGASGATISNSYHYAWSDNVGWIDFGYPGSNVRVPTGAGELFGAAYILSDGSWISLNCKTTDSCSSSNYKVSSDSNGNLSGWAWSENYGWISFSCKTGGSDGGDICFSSNYGVKVATTTTGNYQAGEFDNYAWSENIGWISFNCKTGGSDQSNICSTSNYRVQDLRMNTGAVKIDITLQYNSQKPEQQITKTNSFVFNILTPAK
ncbi:MAG TPA: hypothetical protein PK418_01870 [Candidatus Paceibacterota bacterium]|nr:hypothetical protein [Candidatus Paceibacterota bacterium]